MTLITTTEETLVIAKYIIFLCFQRFRWYIKTLHDFEKT